jgi:hypothetical protein
MMISNTVVIERAKSQNNRERENGDVMIPARDCMCYALNAIHLSCHPARLLAVLLDPLVLYLSPRKRPRAE